MLPGGALLIDTPGMRELQPWDGEAGLATTFDDIIQLAESCRFADCSHDSEPDCAVLEAVSDGRLDIERLQSFRRLGAEARSKPENTIRPRRPTRSADGSSSVRRRRRCIVNADASKGGNVAQDFSPAVPSGR